MDKIILNILTLLLIPILMYSQLNKQPSSHVNDSVYLYILVDQLPIFNKNNGNNEVNNYIYSRFKWPSDFGGEGTIIFSFIVELDGSLSNIKVERGLFFKIDDQCVKILKSMPKWHPGILKGKKIRVKMFLPLEFKITY